LGGYASGSSLSLHAVIWTAVGKSLTGLKQIQAQTDDISSYDTLSDAAEPFHVLHMDSMSDVSMCNQLLWLFYVTA
jgi:hypothetical protein